MSTITTTPGPIPPMPGYRITVDEYHAMIAAGVLGEDDPVELLEGMIVAKMPRNPPHDGTISIVADRFNGQRLPPGWFARIQSTITTATSEPEPDIAIVRGTQRDYLTRHPGPADMALVIEVSDSSLTIDRTVKARIYASGAIPLYWIVNLVDRRIEAHSYPAGGAYRTIRSYSDAESVPFAIDGMDLGPIAASDLLP